MKAYRPEVDGLRMLAVGSVIIFHIWPNALPGGFLGVDVFFVISGYLITRLIVTEVSSGEFSIANFYVRRIRRILPAQILTVAACLTFFSFILLPSETSDLGKSALYSLFSVANIYFWMESGYFGALSENSPLLHMWSLSVEEQFYVFWPFIILLVFSLFGGFKKLTGAAVLFAIFFSSLLLALFLTAHYPSASFYIFASRAFEFVIGAFLALGVLPKLQARAGEAVGLLSLLALVASFFWITSDMAHPGLLTLIPCLATAGLIYGAESETWTKRLLSQKVVVHVGLLSYSLYLVHWPVVVGYRVMTGQTPDLATGLILVVAIYLLSAAMHYGWERPLRYGRLGARFRLPAVPITVFTLLIASFASAHLWAQGRPVAEPRIADTGPSPIYVSRPLDPDRFGDREPCARTMRVSDTGGGVDHDLDCGVDVLVIGDSHSGHSSAVLEKAMQRSGQDLVISRWSMLGCPPIFGAWKIYNRRDLSVREEACRTLIQHWENEILASDVGVVALSARWGWLTEPGADYGGDIHRRDALVTAEDDPQTSDHSRAVMAAQMAYTVERLRAAGKRVILVTQAPLQTRETLGCVETSDDPTACGVPLDLAAGRHAHHRVVFHELAASSDGVYALDYFDYLCDASSCVLHGEDMMLYRDRDHLNEDGASFIADRLPVGFVSFVLGGLSR